MKANEQAPSPPSQPAPCLFGRPPFEDFTSHFLFLGVLGVLCESLNPLLISHRRAVACQALLQFPCNLLPEELWFQGLRMLAPAENPVLHLVRPRDFGRENNRAVLLGLNLLSMVPDLLPDVTGHLNDEEGCGSPDRHNPPCVSQDSPP